MSKKLHNKKEQTDSSDVLLTLIPRVLQGEEKERIKPYLKRLKQAIDQEGIRNIALTGNYGSGKSTILKTFENEYSDYNYLPISLASFKDHNGNDEKEKNKNNPQSDVEREVIENNLPSDNEQKFKDNFEKKLEISILQQIFYRVGADEIPDSRFKRIKDFDNTKTRWLFFFSALWLISVFFLFGFDFVNDLNPRVWDLSKSPSWIAIGSAFIFILGLSYLMKFGVRSFSNSKINKFSIKGEIEFAEASVFNNYLDEIIYFFEKTEYDVVIFEDLDRFDTTSIFTKLRELNNLINNCEIINRNNREINFIYAIKDMLFKDKTERVKFFDFIIPVIPFVNSKNASEQLNKLVREHDLSDKLSGKFISELVSFIHDIDMRLLINTFHEYNVFKENIGADDINHEHLFSIIVYKNLYPEDFSKLYRKSGKLYDVISKREEYELTLTRELRSEIQDLEEEIEELDNHNHIQIKELRSVYIFKLLERLPNNFDKVVIDNNKIDPFALVEDEHFKKLQLSKNIVYTQSDMHGRRGTKKRSDFGFNNIEKELNNLLTYEEREQYIIDRNNNQTNSIKNEILAIKNRIRDIKKLSLAEIFNEMHTNDVFGEFKDNDLVRYLLMGGYINENYSDYISLFHEQDLTRDEFKYRNAIKSLKDPDFEFQVENKYALVNDLDVRYFSKHSILNYDIIEYLIKNRSLVSEKLSMFYSSIVNQDSKYFDFLIGFIEEKPDCRKDFIANLIKNRKSFWDELFHRSNLPKENILNIVTYLFEYSDTEDLQKLDNVESLKGYLENLENPISFGASLDNKNPLKEFISSQSVKFKSLEKPDSSSLPFFDFVINNNSYEINYQNLITILKANLPGSVERNIQQAIYTKISESELANLKEYVEQHINEFVSKVLLHNNESLSENEGPVVALVNNKDLKSQLKTEFVNIQKHRINSLDLLDYYEAREIVMSASKVKPTWDNVYHYYNQFDESTLNETIINFLNSEENYSELSENKLFDTQGIDKKKLSKFRDDVLYCDELSPDAYRELLKSLVPIDSVDYTKLNLEMAEILLEVFPLELNSHNFNGLKTLNGGLHIRLVEMNIQSFIENEADILLDSHDWYLLLNSGNIDLSQKRKLLKQLSASELTDSKLAKKVLELHPDQKVETFSFDEVEALLAHENSLDSRISILLLYIDDLSNDQLKSIISQFGWEYGKLFKLNKKPSFVNNKFNEALLNKLVERRIISSSDVKRGKLRAYCFGSK